MGKKAEKIELFGTLKVPKTTNEILEDVARDVNLEQRSRSFASIADDDKREVHRNALYIIADDGKFFRTAVKSISFDLGLVKDDIRVRFTTPKEQIGKFRWAHEVHLA